MGKRDGWMTIEELSSRSGVTTRNIRAYQGRGLLPAPVSRPGQRSAFYTAEHLARLRLVNRLQERGFSLAGIADLLQAWGAGQSLEQVLGIESAIAESEAEESIVLTAADLRARLPPGADPEDALRKLVAVGLVVPHGRDYRLRHPKVVELGIDATRAGISFDALLDEFVRLQDDLHAIALRFVTLFITHVLQPYFGAGAPRERLPEITDELKRLRSLSVEATVSLMRQAMADEIEATARENLPAPGGDIGLPLSPPTARAPGQTSTGARERTSTEAPGSTRPPSRTRM
ncbi:MAG TPA: MerR family transcriptional regulator [Candidatus Binatia bacterium]|nr:MerR family transcriptional regulator [Candidatus Binatia bacterium]